MNKYVQSLAIAFALSFGTISAQAEEPYLFSEIMTEAELEAGLISELTVPIPELLPPGTVLLDDVCYGAGCAGTLDAVISASPVPKTGPMHLDYQSWGQHDEVWFLIAPITIWVDIIPTSGPGIACTIKLSRGSMFMVPLVVVDIDPETEVIDAWQVIVAFNLFDIGAFGDTDCDASVVLTDGPLTDAVLVALDAEMEQIMFDYAWELDANGKTRAEAAIETVLDPSYQPTIASVPALGSMPLWLLAALLSAVGIRRSGVTHE